MMVDIVESFGRIGDPDDSFDLDFWQGLGPEAIFQAAFEMALDWRVIRQGYADKPRLQRTVEFFSKA